MKNNLSNRRHFIEKKQKIERKKKQNSHPIGFHIWKIACHLGMQRHIFRANFTDEENNNLHTSQQVKISEQMYWFIENNNSYEKLHSFLENIYHYISYSF